MVQSLEHMYGLQLIVILKISGLYNCCDNDEGAILHLKNNQ